MANNFRLSSSGYFSKDGNDADTGLTPDLPKATITNAFSSCIIGTGQYKQAFSLAVAAVNRSYNADHFVKFLLTSTLVINSGNNGSTVDFNEISGSGFIFIEGQSNTIDIRVAASNEWNRLIFKDVAFSVNNGSIQATECIYNNVSGVIIGGNLGGQSVTKSSFFNSAFTLLNTSLFIDNYVDSSTVITMTSYFTTPASQFTNCCFQGQFNIGGTLYEMKQDENGNPIDPNPAVNDIALIDATVYDRGNFGTLDPQFLNLAKQDYWSVASTSPLLFGATGSNNIGNVRAGTLIKVGVDLAALQDIVLDTGDYVYDIGAGTGFGVATFGAKQIAPIPQIITYNTLAALLNFDSLQAIGSAENTNVPAVDNYTAGTAGANPRRLTYEMRWSVSDTVPTIDAEWDNDGIVTAGNYSKFEHFKQPRIDVSSLGNGDPLYAESGSVPIQAKWVQIKIYLQEGIG